MMRFLLCASFFSMLVLSACKHKHETPVPIVGTLQINSAKVGTASINLSGTPTTGLPVNQPISLTFSAALDLATTQLSILLKDSSGAIDADFSYIDNNKTVSITPKQSLANNKIYTISISNQLKGASKEEFAGLEITFKTKPAMLNMVSLTLGEQAITTADRIIDIPLDLVVEVGFSAKLNTATITSSSIGVTGPNASIPDFEFSEDSMTVYITWPTPLKYLSKYTLSFSSAIEGANGEQFSAYSYDFYSAVGNHTSGFPALTDNQLLDLIQHQTFNYFWNTAMGAHPSSGMARERNTSGNTVTTGGSGFGIMALIVGAERGFITKPQAITRLNTIVAFLESADRFHGAWGHWMDGNSGHIIPFSSNDNGGDLVETSFLMQGLITFRQYLAPSDTAGNNLINRITTLYNDVEWDWYRRCETNCQDVIYWHWSPDKGWIMNFPLYGYFEEQITYFLAAGSPTHGIPKSVYSNGYGLNGSIVKNNTYTYDGEGYQLPLAAPAPLFWTQYSYLGLNPHFTDDYTDYWIQNTNASLINHAYCHANPNKYAGYSDECWGLTASDNPTGYGAQSVGNDNGTITPTAALSAFPYTPTESIKALRFFYDIIGDRIWDSTYGPHDAFNVTAGWYADSYLAIDQGPIPVMIENYRTGKLWNMFLSAPEVQTAQGVLDINFNQ